jgi:hypothetical protein
MYDGVVGVGGLVGGLVGVVPVGVAASAVEMSANSTAFFVKQVL